MRFSNPDNDDIVKALSGPVKPIGIVECEGIRREVWAVGGGFAWLAAMCGWRVLVRDTGHVETSLAVARAFLSTKVSGTVVTVLGGGR